MLPTPGDIHVNQPLSDYSLGYRQDAKSFVADHVAPCVPVEHQSNTYYTYTRDYWFRDDMKERGPGAPAAETGYGVSTDTYKCVTFAVKQPIPDQALANADAVIKLDQEATNIVTDKELLRRELAFSTAALATSKWTTDVTGVSGTPSGAQVKQWNSSASTPLEDIAAYQTTMQGLTGKRGNVLTIGRNVWDYLKNNAEIIDRVKYGASPGAPARVTLEAVAALMELDEINVMDSIYATSNEGAALATSYIGGKVGLLTYRAPQMGPMTPTAIATFCWNNAAGFNTRGTRIKKYYVDEKSCSYVEIDSWFTQKIVAPDLGVFFASLVA